MRLCIIARADLTGLGIQSRNWVRLLNPHKVIVINSKPFNNNEQHFEWYRHRPNTYIVDGFIRQNLIEPLLKDIDVLLTFEIPYNYQLISAARAKGIKTIIQNNWEFTDYLKQPGLPLPDLLVNHSYWHLEEQKNLWSNTEYCPTPLFIADFEDNYIENMNREYGKVRFLHIAGRKTHEDRNGTQDLLEAIKLIPKDVDFELVIKTQTTELPEINDSRVVIDASHPLDEKELYFNFDAVIMPRRYGGACLPMNEALASGLPVIMTDIDPNNKILPETWLVKTEKKTEFMARVMIDVFSADHQALADKITDFSQIDEYDLVECRFEARDIAEREYSSEVVKKKWDSFLNKLK